MVNRLCHIAVYCYSYGINQCNKRGQVGTFGENMLPYIYMYLYEWVICKISN